MVALFVGAFLLLASLAAILSMSFIPDANGNHPVASIAYVSHARIVITSNSDFANMAATNGWTGDGSASNPYIIQGYDIDGTGSQSAIAIGNTTVHFRLTGCNLHGAATSGVVLFNATTGTIDNTTCSSNGWYGIAVSSSTGIIVDNASCSSNTVGIWLLGSADVRLRNSNCSYNQDGVELSSSAYNYVDNCRCKYNAGRGIVLDSSRNSTMTRNEFSSNGGTGVVLLSSSNCTLTDNLAWVNYGAGMDINGSDDSLTGSNCQHNGGGGIYVSGAWDTLNHSVCIANGRGSHGITLNYANWCVVSNSTCQLQAGTGGMLSDPGCGIMLRHSTHNLLVDNLCSFNDGHGISLTLASDWNVIRHNQLVSSTYAPLAGYRGAGLFISSSVNNMVQDNNCSDNRGNGMYALHSDDNSFENNTCDANGFTGISIVQSAFILVHGNSLESNGNTGLLLERTQTITVSNNTMASNGIGVDLYRSYFITLRGNHFTGEGIENSYDDSNSTWDSHHIDVTNTVNGKPVYYFSKASGGTVPADAGQIILASCSNMVIENQTVRNAGIDITLVYSTKIEVRNCLLSGSRLGILIGSTSGCQIEKNGIFDHSSFGVWITQGTGNTIWNNTFARNNGATDTYDAGHIQASSTTGNHWNSSGIGNFWNDWQTPDLNYDGIVDLPYTLTGSPGVQDNYPLISQPVAIPELGPLQLVGTMAALISLILCFGARRPRK